MDTHRRIHGHDDAKSSKILTPTSLALKPFITSLVETQTEATLEQGAHSLTPTGATAPTQSDS